MIFLAYKSRLFDPVWKFRKFVTCSCCNCHPQSRKVPLRTSDTLRLGKCLNTCSCSTDLAMYICTSTNSLYLVQHKSVVTIKFIIDQKSSPIEKIALHFLKNSSKIQLHMDLTITLDWESSVCQGRPSASPKPLNPSKAAHPSRPFCIGDRMRLANLSENLHLPTF